jgi:predicted DNA binding CopG/RHH family protein
MGKADVISRRGIDSSANRSRKPVTMRIDVRALDYFKAESERTGIPYQNIINMYLMQCAEENKKLKFT